MASINKILSPLWVYLDDRQTNILAGRFGLDPYDRPQTLAALGKEYGITRERIRQIESSGLKILKEKALSHSLISEFAERSRKYIRDSGGVSREEDLLEHQRALINDLNHNHLDFLHETTAASLVYPEDKNFWFFYYLDKNSLEKAIKFIEEWVDFLQPRKEEILSATPNYQEYFQAFIRKRRLETAVAESYLRISKKFHVNYYGDVGLTEWPEIKPIAVREHIYLVLKKEKKPLHFLGLARLINEKGVQKRVLEATVHNELIKDPRFVLVGRGMYGLAEHGYQPGTAREVIKRILKENGPMRTREVIASVQKERFFKPNTILVNLQNKNFFLRKPDGTYQIRR